MICKYMALQCYLIITGDDFGFSAERNKGVMEAFNKGAIKSASVLLNCSGTDEAIALFQTSKLCPEGIPVGRVKYKTLTTTDGIFKGKFGLTKDLDVGLIDENEVYFTNSISKISILILDLYLNLTEGKPVSVTPYTTLTDSTGIFHGMVYNQLDEGKIDKSEIKREIDAQIEKFKQLFGTTPVYVDGHQHVHIHPKVVDIFADALKCNNILITRYPLEINMPSKNWVNPDYVPFFDVMLERAEKAKPIFDRYGIRTTDSFTGLSTMGSDMTVERLQSNILEAFTYAEQNMTMKLADQWQDFVTCELMTHPGYPTNPDFGGFSWGSDDFGKSADRVHEINVISSMAMMDFYIKNNIQIVSHNILLSQKDF